MLTFYFLLINVQYFVANAFIPHPAIRLGGQAGNSITHTELVQLGFIRSLTRFFLDAQIQSKSSIDVENFKAEHTIDELYQLAHPDWTNDQRCSVDLNPSTKNLPSTHFDSESFKESNDRIIQLRNKILEDANDPNKDLDKARGRIGDLLHTLQDFYSHSNWIEMGKTKINDRIGIHEDIGQVAGKNQATCTNNGCTKIQTKCVGLILH
ncbi:unnamed protein product [Adineta steineri]|uniref:VWA7 N-terminal domain-containing protein n=1 Tax=Adineta steineri TaxID=433720 RepID=A0A813NMT2_9BILA|nr:unnamed protein product [Adineta steineri]CAF4277896.1 unnamed protein product [Adineta steineri]